MAGPCGRLWFQWLAPSGGAFFPGVEMQIPSAQSVGYWSVLCLAFVVGMWLGIEAAHWTLSPPGR